MGPGDGGAGKVVEGALRPLRGVLGADLLEGDGIAPLLLRVLETGSAGSAMEGGPFEGRDGRGSVVVMVIARPTGWRRCADSWGVGEKVARGA